MMPGQALAKLNYPADQFASQQQAEPVPPDSLRRILFGFAV
jgi:hypothetical protein